MEYLNRFGPLVGRILLATIFVLSGIGKITGFDATVGYIAAKALPMPQILAIAAIVVELGAGLMLVAGWKARAAAAALLVFTGLAAFLFHAFWAVPPAETAIQRIQFLKNLAIMGGLFYVMVYGSGPVSASGDRE
jgi:putative oxidoreductase